MTREELIKNCRQLLQAYNTGLLGQTIMPEDSHPDFKTMSNEFRIAYFTLPMALNYQRNSYKLWDAALETFHDPETQAVFNIAKVSRSSEDEVRKALIKHKVALQPNKHVYSWLTIARTVYDNWGSFTNFFESIHGDFLILKQRVYFEYKKDFPYLSGPKIFHYWSFVVSTYGGVELHNRDYIEIAPDTHITRCSVRLGVITSEEAASLAKDALSSRWRQMLEGSGINPIDMHPPLWFWSRNGFIYKLQ